MLMQKNVYVCDVCASESEIPMAEYLGIHVCSFCEEQNVMQNIHLYGNVKDQVPDDYDIPDDTPVHLNGDVFSILGERKSNFALLLTLGAKLERLHTNCLILLNDDE